MAQGTFFADIHQELGAKTVPFGKWDLPLFYPGGSIAEHRHTRSDASLFDMSARRIFQLAGDDAGAKLDPLFTLSAAGLPVGGMMENVLLHEDGTFAAIFTLCRMKPDDFMLLMHPGIAAKEVDYLLNAAGRDLELRELSSAMAMLNLTGKRSPDILSAAGAAQIPGPGHWQMGVVRDEDGEEFRCIIIRHNRFGEPGFDICCNAAVALEVYGALYRIPGAEPAGSTAWESLRVESMMPDVPGELHSAAFPQECGLGKMIDPGREFTGKAALKNAAISRRIMAVRLERHPARPGTPVVLSGGIVIGVVTGGAFCPTAGAAQVFCSLDADAPVSGGSEVFCTVGGERVAGTVIGEVFR